MMNRPVILVIAICIALCASCTKKVKRQAVYTNAALTEYFNYGIGSYWVYHDSVSGADDSLYVTGSITKQPYYDGITATQTKIIDIQCAKDAVEWILYIEGDNVRLETGKEKNYVSSSISYGWPFSIGSKDLGGDGSLQYPHYKYECIERPFYEINSTTYKNTFETSFYVNADYNKFIFFNEGFLYIEINYLESKKYYLLRHKIEK